MSAAELTQNAPSASFPEIPGTKPKWAKEIERFLAIKSQFLLYGNVNDVFPAALR